MATSTPIAPSDAQRTTWQLKADVLFLAGFDRARDLVVASFQAAHVIPSTHEVSRRNQHRADDEFLYGVGVGPWCVKYGNTQLGQLCDGNVVNPGTRAADRAETRGNLDVAHVIGPHEYCVGVRYLCAQFVAVARKARQPFTSNVIQRQDFESVCHWI